MRASWVGALVLASMTLGSAARAADGRFFLLVADEPPQSALVQSALSEAARITPTLGPEAARARIAEVFPRLFAVARRHDLSAFEADLKAARAAHYNGRYQDSEEAFERALAAALEEPELLEDERLAQRLVDGAATRYRNTLARKRPRKEARQQIAAFLDRYPLAAPTASDHAPEVIKAWNEVRTEHRETHGTLVVNVLPLELERGGSCRLFVNGAEVAALPQAGPLGVPRGEHLLQVRCGAQASWLQRVTIGAATRSLRVPVRAMLAARGDAATGGVVLVAPADGDAASLVSVLSRASDLAGASVAIAHAPSRVELGRWDADADVPTLLAMGHIEGTRITEVGPFRVDDADTGSGRVWTWVVGGLGIATLGGAVVANVITADKIKKGEPDTDDLKTATVALYVAGGALLATGVILFFVEGDDEDADSDAVRVVPGPGGLAVRF